MSAGYDWDPSGYQRHSGPQARAAEELLSRLSLRPHEVILDIGCGDGRHSAALATRVPQGRVVGMDLSEDMVEFATNQFPRSIYPNLEFALGDARALGYVAEFSMVFSTSALHWIEDHASLLSSIARALRPGGRFYMQMVARGSYDTLIAASTELTQDPRWRSYFQDFALVLARYDADEYRALIEGAGLVADEVNVLVRDVAFSDCGALSGFWRNVAHPFTSRLPEEQRSVFADAVAERYVAALASQGNSAIVVTTRRLRVAAHLPNN